MSNEFSTPKLTPADAVKIPGVDGNNDSGYLLSEEVKDYMFGGLYGETEEYSTLETYTVGDRVTNEGDLYRCTTAVSTPEVFDPTKWTKVDLPSLDERVSDNESAIEQNTEDIATNAENIQANSDAITSLKYHLDTSNLIDTYTWSTGSEQFTCTEDCYLIFNGRMQANSNGIMTITINGVTIADVYTPNVSLSAQAFVWTSPLLSVGDTVSIYLSSNYNSTLKIFGVK